MAQPSTSIVVHLPAHPLLHAAGFVTVFPRPLADLPSPPELTGLFKLDARAPLSADDAVRSAVRDLLRHGGYKPTGRGKPASEYLLRAAGEGTLSSINLAVDACNAVSLHAGLPISVIDLDRAKPPLAIAVAADDASYVFNASGQTIDLGGLLCLCDADGPCANAVKDAQRTKTSAGTQTTLSILWGYRGAVERTERAAAWYRELLTQAGAKTDDVTWAGAL
ncbi:MAG TPA: phenylalanine--tRNA ligase beta subunit-related protein [Pseudomonadota bacterium]|nr:phenylalanine--tRNA ligase beta subunit-related protein [Pseudomonadota bacterium]